MVKTKSQEIISHVCAQKEWKVLYVILPTVSNNIVKMVIATLQGMYQFVSVNWVLKENIVKLILMIVFCLLGVVPVKMGVFVLMELQDMIVIVQEQVL